MQILAATGGAKHSDTAVQQATFLAHKTNGTLTLLTVIKHKREQVQAESILKRTAALVVAQAVAPQKRIRTGHTAEEIVAEAREGNYDLIVMGERPSHTLVKKLLGPTVERVITHLPCPLLIARQKNITLNRLLLCEGGRDPSLLERLVKQLLPLLQATEELTVLHVMSQMAATPSIPGWELLAEAEELIARQSREGELLEQDRETLKQLPVHLQTKIRHGLVVEEILAEARDGAYDLVIIGAHQGSKWERFLLDDLSHQIVTKSSNSILII